MQTNNTKNDIYAQRLINIQNKKWKKKLTFLNPYKYHLNFICKGKVLEIGCGIGRVLNFMPSRIVGIDHNIKAIEVCKEMKFSAFTTEEFFKTNTGHNSKYDTLLFSHILEHMSFKEANKILKEYLPFLKIGGNIILITPQQKGFNSDHTHIHPMNIYNLKKLAKNNDIKETFTYSFPLPKLFGKYFIYNENVFIGKKL